MDVRILREELAQEKGKEINTAACLQWAFGGKSRTSRAANKEKGAGGRETSHTVWDHWIDSKSNDPETDEGDMTLQEDGTVLEEGVNLDPVTGAKIRYEELWRDLPVESFGKKNNRSSMVLRAEDLERNAKGLVVKVGGWCQGFMKVEDSLTIERWQWKPKGQTAVGAAMLEGVESTRTRNDWIRVFKIGTEILPCRYVLERTEGRSGSNLPYKNHEDAIEWRVIEEYYW